MRLPDFGGIRCRCTHVGVQRKSSAHNPHSTIPAVFFTHHCANALSGSEMSAASAVRCLLCFEAFAVASFTDFGLHPLLHTSRLTSISSSNTARRRLICSTVFRAFCCMISVHSDRYRLSRSFQYATIVIILRPPQSPVILSHRAASGQGRDSAHQYILRLSGRLHDRSVPCISAPRSCMQSLFDTPRRI